MKENNLDDELREVLGSFAVDEYVSNFLLCILLNWYNEGASGRKIPEIRAIINPILSDFLIEIPKRERLWNIIERNESSGDALGILEVSEAVVPVENPVQMDLSPLTLSMRDGNKVSLDWLANKKVVLSQVNQERLQKVISRHRMRAEKRGLRQTSTPLGSLRKVTERSLADTISQEWDFETIVNDLIMDVEEDASNRLIRDISLEHFDVSLGGKRILTDANITLAYGRRYGLVGRNGVGKSTLLRNISSRTLNVPNNITILHVEQEVAGDRTTALQSVLAADFKRSALLYEEQRLQQVLQTTSDSEMPRLTRRLDMVYRLLEERDASSAEARASAILAGLGFDAKDQHRPTEEFSGGWRMRIALARALFCQPDLLLLDEPTNMLDFPSVVWLEGYLLSWRGTILVVSHDRCFLDNITTDIVHMHNEYLDSYRGNYTQFLATKEERLTNQQREYEAQLQYRQHLQSFVDRWRYNANRAAQAQSRIKILEKLPELRPVVAEAPVVLRFPTIEAMSPPILHIDEVAFSYDGSSNSRLLDNINFNVQPTSRIAIVGPNGAGKTTLLKLLSGQLEPTKGRVYRHGRLRIGFFTQHHVDQLDLELSPIQLLQQHFPGKPDEEYRHALGSFGLSGPLALQTTKTLSGGQKSRVAFTILSMERPHIMILDEPTNHLDMDTIEALIKALKEYAGGVLIVSHDKRFVNSLCDEIWVCQGGHLQRFEGSIFDYADKLLKSRSD